jgi:predicted enzyme related to lactoylglutathione lyase
MVPVRKATGDQERQADEAQGMKHEQRPQGFVAPSGAQFRPDSAAGDYAPSNETEDDADKKKQICARMTGSSDEAAFINSSNNPDRKSWPASSASGLGFDFSQWPKFASERVSCVPGWNCRPRIDERGTTSPSVSLSSFAISELESSMNQVKVEQKSYQMPPQDGITVAHFLTVADIERSLRFYETVFGSHILSRGDSKGAPGYIQIANTWLIVNVGGGPTPDKPSVTLSVPANPDSVNSFMNIRVADIQACYELWRSRGADFITEPKDKYGETRCYIRDPDGYIIEVGQSKTGVAYG